MTRLKSRKLIWLIKLTQIRLTRYMSDFPANIYLLQVNYKNTRKRYEICSKLTIKTQEQRQWRLSGVFTVNFGHISNLFIVFLLLLWTGKYLLGFSRGTKKKTYNRYLYGGDSEQLCCFIWLCTTRQNYVRKTSWHTQDVPISSYR